MTNLKLRTQLELPDWMGRFLDGKTDSALDDPMQLAVALSAKNVEEQTGGPFGACLVDKKNVLVSVGVNLVVPQKNPTLHGEMVALIFAADNEADFNLSHLKLYSSAEPCAMCAGAIHWAGVQEIYYAASSQDVVDCVGFDEGPVHPNWHGWNKERGHRIEQLSNYREKAVEVLRRYKSSGEAIYNSKNHE